MKTHTSDWRPQKSLLCYLAVSVSPSENSWNVPERKVHSALYDLGSATSRVRWRKTNSTVAAERKKERKKGTSKPPTNSPVVSSKGCWNLYPLACEIPKVWRSRFAPTLLPELTATCWQLTVVHAEEQIVQKHPVATRPFSINNLRHPGQNSGTSPFVSCCPNTLHRLTQFCTRHSTLRVGGANNLQSEKSESTLCRFQDEMIE